MNDIPLEILNHLHFAVITLLNESKRALREKEYKNEEGKQWLLTSVSQSARSLGFVVRMIAAAESSQVKH